ncbi:putative glycoprotein [Wenling fish chu-like virus]|uniref:Putative glycoprotein n=2 Tax=Riboviria TaxID=2559587 RepID=A0A2P1GMP9_9VIRU|nr:putative glycoprotein [Wenling fish chu-like virus]AVM87276.1 putative glycoprotein [Wenling fish chu-like virus]AVM87279.1 putative glycoprotein [Wenling fish chuvirus-like virus]
MKVILLIILLLGVELGSSTLIGYDCADTSVNATTFDLTTIKECTEFAPPGEGKSKQVQVIQTMLYRPVHLYTCKVRLTRLAYHCGWQSRMIGKPNMLYSGIIQVGEAMCRRIHHDRSFVYGGITVAQMQPNTTTSVSATLAGSIDSSGNCYPVSKYIDAGGAYDNVVVQGVLEISIYDYIGTAMLTEQKITVPRSGLTCPAGPGYCRDTQEGEVVWTFSDEQDCKGVSVEVLYQGIGTVYPSGEGDVLIVRSRGNSFALRLHDPTVLCAQEVLRTEHARILVFVRSDDTRYFPFTRTRAQDIKNVDLTSYVNSKFLYVTTMTRINTETMYRSLVSRECDLRRRQLQFELTLAESAPDKVAQMMAGPGVYGRLLGEVFYVIQCTAVGVDLRFDPLCYEEIPVVYRNRSMFVTPVTRLVVPRGREVPCKGLLHPRFKLGQKWYTRTPELQETSPPETLDPNVPMNWQYDPIVDVSVGGLYSSDQLEALQNEMMFPSMREAVSTAVARVITSTGGSTLEVENMFSDSLVSGLTDQIAGKLSWFFSIFGHYASMILGIWVILKTIKYVIGTCVNCVILRRYRKPRTYCCLAFVDSLTALYTTHERATHDTVCLEMEEEVFNAPPTAPPVEARTEWPLRMGRSGGLL